MNLRLTALALATPLILCPPAQAQTSPPLPNWDAIAHCERQNRIMATESAFLLNACLQQEDRALGILRQSWDAVPAGSRRTCLHQQEVMRMATYFLLNACVELERGALRDIERRAGR
jgi:hypothetical protein